MLQRFAASGVGALPRKRRIKVQYRTIIAVAAAVALGCVPLATAASAAGRAGVHAGARGGHAVAGHARGGHFAGRHVGGRRVVRGYRGNGGYAGYGGGYAGYGGYGYGGCGYYDGCDDNGAAIVGGLIGGILGGVVR